MLVRCCKLFFLLFCVCCRFSLHIDGSALFEHKGLVDVTLPEADLESALAHPDNFNLDKFVDVAIEAGAEDVSLEPGEEQPYLKLRI